MLGTAIFLERDECGSIPVIRCFPAGSHAPAAELTCSSGYGWVGCVTPCTVQHRIRNCGLRSSGKIPEKPGRMLQACCTVCGPGLGPAGAGAPPPHEEKTAEV